MPEDTGDDPGEADDGSGSGDATVEPERGVGRQQRLDETVAAQERPQRQLQSREGDEGVRDQRAPERDGDDRRRRGDRRQQPARSTTDRSPAAPRRPATSRCRPPPPRSMASTQATRLPTDSTISTANPATTAPATRGTGDGAGSQITATETSTSAPLTCSGITPVSTSSPRSAERRLVAHPVGPVVVPGVAAVGGDLRPLRLVRSPRYPPATTRRSGSRSRPPSASVGSRRRCRRR